MLIQKIKGKFKSVKWVADDGHTYRFKRLIKNKNSVYVACAIRGCGGTGFITFQVTYEEDPEVGELIEKSPHTAGAACNDVKYYKVQSLRNKILERAAKENTPNSIIFQQEISSAPVDVRNALSFAEIERSMQRAHANANPRSVESLNELATEIENWNDRFGKINNELFFLGLFGTGNEECVIAVVTPLISGGIDLSANWHVDGTFKCRPKKPAMAQLYVIMASKYGRAYPIVWALMRSKSREAYDVLFAAVKDHMPGINPCVIMGDYEKAARGSLRRHFPAANIVGCWFHFSQAIERNTKKVGINPNGDGWIVAKRLMATALLPHDRIEEAVLLIEAFAATTTDRDKAIRLVEYFKRQWLGVVTAKSFSVFGQTERTNNCQESLNRCINRTITPQGNTWDFWNGIRAVSTKEINYFHQLREGRNCARGKKNKWLLQNSKIKSQQDRLIRGELTLNEFLGATSHLMQPENRDQNMDEDQDIDPDDDPELDGLDVLEGNNEEEEEEGEENVNPQEPYLTYRVVPITILEGCPMPEEHVIRQQEELRLGLQGVEEATVRSEEGQTNCMVCLENKATRMCSPCGHAILCRQCAGRFVDELVHEQGVLEDGEYVQLNVRLPLTCPACRSIIGQLVRMIL